MRGPLARGLPALAVLSTLACLALPARGLYAKRTRPAGAAARRSACEAFAAHRPTVTAQAGDTLWSLTARNTGKPWIWPQIWALNPQLANPHWLMPGEVVHFVARPRAAALASDAPADGPPLAAEVGLAAPAASEPAVRAQASALPAPKPAAAPRLAAEPSLPSPPRYACLPAAFFSHAEVDAFGRLERSTSEAMLWRQGDRIEASWPEEAKAGDGPWAVVRTAEGSDTYDGASASGVIATCTGVVRATGGHGPTGRRLEVVMAREELGCGQRLVPLAAMALVAPAFVATSPQACGRVLALEHEALTGNPLHLVFVDVGTADGVRPGSELVGPGQGRGGATRPRLKVVQAGLHTATAAALGSPEELSVGERFCGADAPQS